MPEITKRLERAELAKRIERAEKLLQKGKAAEALEEYLQSLHDDPENDTVRQLAADLCLSQNRNPDAVRLLGELFERQVNAGDATRASLTYKKLARHGSPTWEQKFRFGQLLEGSNKKLAVGTYESALSDLAKLENKKGALQVLGRVVALEPMQANFLRLAEMSSELGESKAAGEAFKRVAQLAAAGGGDPAQWYERAYQEDSSDEEITLAYGKSLLGQGQVGAAIFILEPQVNAGKNSTQLREIYAEALLAAGRYAEAEPLVWQLFEQNANWMPQVTALMGQLVDAEQDVAAVLLARKLGQVYAKRGERRQFLTVMQETTAARRASPEMLEFMGELFNASNREGDYCQTLLRLFDVYCGTGDFGKAAECLDRAAEVDPYESGHAKRLELLKGKIDEGKLKAIASRFTSAGPSAAEKAIEHEATLGASTLQDLMLQAEILVQYGMRNKAVERLQRIQELFPREEERNEDLQRLYLAAGVTPSYAGSAARPAAAAATPSAAVAPPAVAAPVVAPDPAAEMRNVTRVAEITRKLYHQGTAPAVLTTAVNEIGGHWEVSRCVAFMRTPGSAPTAVQEFCGRGVKAGSSAAIKEVMIALQDISLAGSPGEPIMIADAQKGPELQSVRKAVAELGATAVLAFPLSNGEDSVGVLALLHNKARVWPHTDAVVLKTLADQMVIALNNAGLRRLVKNLSVTEEKSGLLKRGSYLDLLLAESKRAVQNAAPLSVLLLQFGRSAGLIKEYGEAAVEGAMEKIGQQFAANIRTNDLAFRYDTTTIALILGETAEKEAMMAIEKLRKIIAGVRLPAKDGAEKGHAMEFSAGLAEAVVRESYDPVDIVTEVINRAEHALATSLVQGPGKVVALGAAMAAGAVA
ncbi:MAG TPA: tetratricopeptide repeat protein [Candidatus Acidoferrum sp.]|jgi:diguanylate cyclase (GGDEF)-like protein|nr:tetratricopeptide repeat protein [Candidatus Acidoferrum sp.]